MALAVTRQCGLSSFSRWPGLQGAREAGGTQLGQPTQGMSDAVRHQMQQQKQGQGGGRGGRLERWRLSSPATRGGALLSWRWLNTRLPTGRREQIIPHFTLLACAAFALPIQLSASHPRVCSLLLFQFSPPFQGERGRGGCCL